MSKLRILEVSSEVAPFARTGGLGDVVGALPKALARLGHEVKVVLPRYGFIKGEEHGLKPQAKAYNVRLWDELVAYYLETCNDARNRVEYFFINNAEYFDRPDFYVDPAAGKDYLDNDERFVFFSRAVLETIKHLDWRPDIIHVHDWQSALIPAYLKTIYKNDEFFQNTRTVLTIHNLGYQGIFPADHFKLLELPEHLFYAMTGPFEFFGKVNFLKGGIMMADKLTTVSERYAEEIQSTEEYGYGLQGVLNNRTDDLIGILNGVDYHIWSPSRDKKVQYKYTVSNLSGKRKNKIELLQEVKLPVRDSAPLIGMISRLTAQKGWDLIEEAADDIFAMNLQLIVLGTGDAKYIELLKSLEQKYPDKVRAFITFDDTLAHRIEAAADVFLMPSRWEPCGLNQMYSLKYGTVPIVRAVGGLADTVADWDPTSQTGDGFVFEKYDARAMLHAIRRALSVFTRKRTWTRLMKAGMEKDFSWDRSAARYADLFEQSAIR